MVDEIHYAIKSSYVYIIFLITALLLSKTLVLSGLQRVAKLRHPTPQRVPGITSWQLYTPLINTLIKSEAISRTVLAFPATPTCHGNRQILKIGYNLYPCILLSWTSAFPQPQHLLLEMSQLEWPWEIKTRGVVVKPCPYWPKQSKSRGVGDRNKIQPRSRQINRQKETVTSGESISSIRGQSQLQRSNMSISHQYQMITQKNFPLADNIALISYVFR